MDVRVAVEMPHYYWDTCVFIAHFNADRATYGGLIDDIGQFLRESRNGQCVIHCSTITIAEITRDKTVTPDHANFSEFLRDFSSAVVPVSPDPNIMAIASELRSLAYIKTGGTRKLHVPDAIHLASAIALTDTYGVTLSGFHTFDNGKTRGAEGPGTPLLTFETWCEQCADDPLAEKVIDMPRSKPEHPNKQLVV